MSKRAMSIVQEMVNRMAMEEFESFYRQTNPERWTRLAYYNEMQHSRAEDSYEMRSNRGICEFIVRAYFKSCGDLEKMREMIPNLINEFLAKNFEEHMKNPKVAAMLALIDLIVPKEKYQ